MVHRNSLLHHFTCTTPLIEMTEKPKKERDGLQPVDFSANSLQWREAEMKTEKSQIFTETPFSSLGLHSFLVSLLQAPFEKGGFEITTATKVQRMVIPELLATPSRHVLIKSQTGSGKTLTYLLPLMHHLMSVQPPIDRKDGTRALIIAPTRELCGQISDVLERLCKVRYSSYCSS